MEKSRKQSPEKMSGKLGVERAQECPQRGAGGDPSSLPLKGASWVQSPPLGLLT